MRLFQKKGYVQALLVDGHIKEAAEAGESIQVMLDMTPFYGEGGGQVGDRGIITSQHDRCGRDSGARTRTRLYLLTIVHR